MAYDKRGEFTEHFIKLYEKKKINDIPNKARSNFYETSHKQLIDMIAVTKEKVKCICLLRNR